MIEIDELKVRLSRNLPGHSAHRKVMAHRQSIEEIGKLPKNVRRSAVLLLLYPKKNEVNIVFILRQTYKGVHSAQIGLPGGKVEEFDESLLDTALREAKEELSIEKDELEILGELSPLFVPPSNFVIHPFVAFQPTQPKFIPDEYEVAEIIEHPLSELVRPEALIDTMVEIQTGKMKTKGFMLQERLLWGATAMIVQEFVEVLKP